MHHLYGAEYRRRAASAGLHFVSMLVWALFPAWAALFGLHRHAWLSGGILLLFSGAVQSCGAMMWNPGALVTLRERSREVRQAARKHCWPFAASAGVAAEDIGILQSIRFMDPSAVNALTRLFPVVSALWLARSVPGRFHITVRALVGLTAASVGAGLVIWSASSGTVSAGWRTLAGVALAGLAVAGLVVKNTTELAFVASVSEMLGWSQIWSARRDDIAMGVAAAGLRNVITGSGMSGLAAVLAGGMPAKVWAGTALFALVLAPTGIVAGRAAVLVDGDLGLWSINSLGAPVAMGWAWLLLGGIDVGSVWLLAVGVAAISAGSALAAKPGGVAPHTAPAGTRNR